MRVLALCLLAACDPVWDVRVQVRHPDTAPIAGATVAVACADGNPFPGHAMAVRTTPDGVGQVSGLGRDFPIGCDIYVAAPGFATQRIRYRDLCPAGPASCDRGFAFDLVLAPVR